MQPILEDKVDYFQKKVGFGKAATARLYPDSIAFVDKTDTPIVTIPLADITDLKHVKGGLIRFHVGEQFHGMQFVQLRYRLFGLVGFLLSHGGKTAKAWAQELDNLGVGVERKLI